MDIARKADDLIFLNDSQIKLRKELQDINDALSTDFQRYNITFYENEKCRITSDEHNLLLDNLSLQQAWNIVCAIDDAVQCALKCD